MLPKALPSGSRIGAATAERSDPNVPLVTTVRSALKDRVLRRNSSQDSPRPASAILSLC